MLTKHFAFDKLLADVSRRDLMGIVSKLAQTPAEQKYAYVCVRTMLNWCVKQGYLDASPLPQMTFASNPRERMLSQSELIAVYREAEAFSFPFGPIIKMLVLTGQRRSEVAALEWEWIDTDERLISLPAAITKNKRDHTFPYGETAAQLLRAFLRQFANGLPAEYYEAINSGASIPDFEVLFPREWRTAENEALCLELGSDEARAIIDQRIEKLRLSAGDRTVVIGGPPCQAYSLVGRSRNSGNSGYRADQDGRHFLYEEYIRVLGSVEIQDFLRPSVVIHPPKMEVLNGSDSFDRRSMVIDGAALPWQTG